MAVTLWCIAASLYVPPSSSRFKCDAPRASIAWTRNSYYSSRLAFILLALLYFAADSAGWRTSWDICDTPCHTVQPSSGSVGYAANIKCWRKRVSMMLNQLGSVDMLRIGATSEQEDVLLLGDVVLSAAKTHLRLRRAQMPHCGSTSSHFTFRFLQVRQPFRDLRWPLRGIGRRLTRIERSRGLLW